MISVCPRTRGFLFCSLFDVFVYFLSSSDLNQFNLQRSELLSLGTRHNKTVFHLLLPFRQRKPMPTPSVAVIAYQEAHLGDDRRAAVIAPNVVFTIAAIVAVALRFESRRIAKTEIKADDWWILGGLVHRVSRSREETANCE